MSLLKLNVKLGCSSGTKFIFDTDNGFRTGELEFSAGMKSTSILKLTDELECSARTISYLCILHNYMYTKYIFKHIFITQLLVHVEKFHDTHQTVCAVPVSHISSLYITRMQGLHFTKEVMYDISNHYSFIKRGNVALIQRQHGPIQNISIVTLLAICWFSMLHLQIVPLQEQTTFQFNITDHKCHAECQNCHSYSPDDAPNEHSS